MGFLRNAHSEGKNFTFLEAIACPHLKSFVYKCNSEAVIIRNAESKNAQDDIANAANKHVDAA